MKRQTICLIGFLDQDNLGIGYIGSSLLQTDCFDITLIDIREADEDILQHIIVERPLVVGFSVVFQAHLDHFHKLMEVLRKNGITCHFTAGGHYPSLRYDEVLRIVPELDSIVLFEGEHTIVELSRAIFNKEEWHKIDGIAFRRKGAIDRNPLRPLETNLDIFPLPIRRPFRPMILGRKVVNILAGRGCFYNCSFCSIHKFYSLPPGPVKRIRKPAFVTREMQLHYEQEDCAIFLFQDDDFPLQTINGHQWINEFLNQLNARNLAQNTLWKISCRVDEVEEKIFSRLKAHGLGMVYLGIESGSSDGLRTMKKQITPEESLKAVNILKNLNIPFEFGFMLFDPYTTYNSIKENVDFLGQLCIDGSASIGVAKMLALAGTDIEDSLRSQGRLFGQPPFEDYRFLDSRIDECYAHLMNILDSWMHDEFGFFSFSRWVRLQVEAYYRFHGNNNGETNLNDSLWQIVSSANHYLLKTISTVTELTYSDSLTGTTYRNIMERTKANHTEYCSQIADLSEHINALAGVRC